MKKLFVVLVAFVAVIFLASCQKTDEMISKNDLPVSVINGEYSVQNGDIQLKSAPAGHTITWSMLSNNPAFYTGLQLIDGRELITGTAAQIFWGTAGNNPVSFPYGTSVYSNHTPDEDVRIIAETKNSVGNVIYIAMLDFNPGAANFPLTVNGYRFGDELYVDWKQIKDLPGSGALSLKVKYEVCPKDVSATKNIAYLALSDPSGTPNGKELTWVDLKYAALTNDPLNQTVVDVPGTGDIEVLNTIDGKIFGKVTVELYEGNTKIGSQDVDAQGPGKGMRIKVTTDKVGWYHSSTIQWQNHDIGIELEEIKFN